MKTDQIKPFILLVVSTFLDWPYYIRLALVYCMLFICVFLFFPTSHAISTASQKDFSQKDNIDIFKQSTQKQGIEEEKQAYNIARSTLNKKTVEKEKATFENRLKLELEKQLNKQLNYQASTVFRDYLSKESVPYNEGASASLFDKTRQIDNALIQTALKLNVPLQKIKIDSSYVRAKNSTFYLYQKIYIGLPSSVSLAQWNKSLTEQLSLWAHNAKLELDKDKSEAKISVNKLATHELFYAYKENPAKLSIVIDDFGANIEQLTSFLSLDFPITFSVLPDLRNTTKVATLAHYAGSEVLLHQPMEDVEKKFIEKFSLLNTDSKEEIKRKLLRNLEKVPHVIGLNNHTGSGFTANANSVANFLSVLLEEKPSLCVLDSVTTGKTRLHDMALSRSIKTARRNIFLDNIQKEDEILKQLNLALKMALDNPQRHVVVIGHPYKETIAALRQWQGYKHENIEIVNVF